MSRLIPLLMLAPLLNGCWILYPPCGGNHECAEAEAVSNGLYGLDENDREDIVDAVLDVQDDSVVLEYIDDQGNTWEVEYAVTHRVPEDGDRQ